MPIVVHQVSTTAIGGFDSTNCSFATTPTPDRHVVVLATTNPNFGDAVTSFTYTDNQGNTITPQAFQDGQLNACGVGLGAIVTAVGTYTVTVTANPTTSDAGLSVTLLEVSGLDGTRDRLFQLSSANYLTDFITDQTPDTAEQLFIAISAPRSFGSIIDVTPPVGDVKVHVITSGDGAGYGLYRIITAGGLQNFDFRGVPDGGGNPSFAVVSFRATTAVVDDNTKEGHTDYVIPAYALIDQTFAAVYVNLQAEFPSANMPDNNNEASAGYIYNPYREHAAYGQFELQTLAAALAATGFSIPEDGGAAPNIYTLTISGGLVLAGAAAYIKDNTIPVSGGVVLSGAADYTKTNVILISGGIALTGDGNQRRERAQPVSGGINFAGTLIQNHENVIAPSGGVSFSGNAPISTAYVLTASGGAVFAGTAQIERVRGINPSGGITFAGTITIGKEKVLVAAGGFELSGTVTKEQLNTLSPSGGIIFSGGTGIVFIPAGGAAVQNILRLTVGVGRSTKLS